MNKKKMKKFRNIILGMMLAISMFLCVNINAANYVDNSDDRMNIDTLMINVPSNVHIYKTDTFGINIKAANQYIYDNVHWDLKDQLLIINFDNIDMIKNQVIDSNDIRINIGLPNKVKCIKTDSNLQISKTI